MKCTACERWTVVRLRPSEIFFAMLNEALVVNLLHVGVLEWSKITAGRQKTSPQSHIVVLTRKAAQASCADQTFSAYLDFTLRHNTFQTHGHLSQQSTQSLQEAKSADRWDYSGDQL